MVKAEAQAKLEHERLVSLINSMADAVIAVDQYTHVVLFNGAALNILDSNNIVIGDALSKYLKLIDKDGNDVDLVELIASIETQMTSRDYKLVYSSTDKISVYLSIAPVHLGYGQDGARGYVVLLRDITREKSLEEERDEFISVVSHELRTPVTIAEGNLSNAILLGERNNMSATLLDALRQSYDQVGLLANMINDLSTLSRAERNVLTVEPEPINAHDMVELLTKEYGPQCEAKGLKMHSHIDPSVEMLTSSKLYVREILQNFITNAIKYTEEGSVSLSVEPAENGLLFKVSDTGIGISKADQERVYDKFFRSEDFKTRQNSGTGLGLYVTMKLARLIRAQLSLESVVEEGSVFSIFVPNLSPLKVD